MNVELENMELLRKQNECRKFSRKLAWLESNSSKRSYI
jgi:hypothetical protein